MSKRYWKDKEEKIKEQNKNLPRDEEYEPWIYQDNYTDEEE